MFARTRRLTLRPGWPEDAEALAAAIGHEQVARRLSRVPFPYSADDGRAFLSRARGPEEPVFLIEAHEGEAPHLIGGIGLHLEDDHHELGYWLTPAAWGRGYATEAARAVIDIARHALPLHRLRARHHLDNPASARVLAKLGFRRIGTVRTPSIAQGRPVESAMLELSLAADAPAPSSPLALAA